MSPLGVLLRRAWGDGLMLFHHCRLLCLRRVALLLLLVSLVTGLQSRCFCRLGGVDGGLVPRCTRRSLWSPFELG